MTAEGLSQQGEESGAFPTCAVFAQVRLAEVLRSLVTLDWRYLVFRRGHEMNLTSRAQSRPAEIEAASLGRGLAS
jgi:hypothetical protein